MPIADIAQRPAEHAPTLDFAYSLIASTSQIVGEAFFPAMVESLAEALGVRWVLLGRIHPQDASKASTVAVWDNGIGENFEYALAGSPCADVLADHTCCYPDNITQLFPDDDLLRDMGAESYVGTPLRSSTGDVLGLIAALDDRPIADTGTAIEILNLFAGRAAAELERAITATSNERLGRIVEASVSEAYIFDGSTFKFELVNKGARKNLGYSMDELRSLTPWDLKPDYTAAEFRDFVEPLKKGEVPELIFETVHRRKDGSLYDVSVQLQYFPEPDNVFFASITDITYKKESERRERLLMREVHHRAKNLLSVILVMARQTVANSPEDYAERFQERIMALTACYDLLVESAWTDVPLGDLVKSQIGPFSDPRRPKIKIAGPELRVSSSAAQNIAMALHELATNAGKYGALSSDAGQIEIEWFITSESEENDRFEFVWAEMGGPSVSKPSKRGFGSTVIERVLKTISNAEVEINFLSTGVECRFSAPLASLQDTSSSRLGRPR